MGQSLWTLAVTVGIAFVAYAVGGMDALLVAVALSAVVYLASLALHPNCSCWACKGSGKHAGWLFNYSNRQCESCAGSGRARRLGVRVTGIGRNRLQ